MATDFLHGVEVIEVNEGPRPVRTVRSAVIGLVGTAERGPVNTPTLIAGDRSLGASTFGAAGTVGPALEAIFDQIGAAVVVVNCLDPALRHREIARQIALVAGVLTIPDAAIRPASLVVRNQAGAITYRRSLPGRQGDYEYDEATRRVSRVDRPRQDVAAADHMGAGGVWTLPAQRVSNVVVTSQDGTTTYRASLPDRLGDYVVDEAAGQVTATDRPEDVEDVEYETPAGNTATIELAHQRITSVVVKSADESTTYEAPRDYTVDEAAGTITRKAVGTSWVVSSHVHVSYDVDPGPADDATLKIAYRRLVGMGAADTLRLDYDVPDASLATSADVEGEVAADGSYRGIHALLAAEAALGFRPRILCAPGWSDRLAVGNSLIARAERLRATAVIEGPATTDADAIAYAGDLTASRRAYLVEPEVLVDGGDGGTVRRPCSAHVAGVIALSDNERGFWWSPSNRVIQGILGTSRPIDFALGDAAARANLLNERNVAVIIREDGHRLWGNRTLSDDARYAFLSVARTADLIQDSIRRAHLWAVDRNITRTYLEAVAEGVNAYIGGLVSQGALAGGSCVPSDTNSAAKIAAGQACFDVDFTPYSPAERVTFRVALTDDYLEEVI